MQASNVAWGTWDPVTAAHLNQFWTDIATIFQELSNEDLSFTYNIQWRLTQLVDNENSITINIDWSQFDYSSNAKLFIQKVWDLKKYTISYDASGYISSIIYAL